MKTHAAITWSAFALCTFLWANSGFGAVPTRYAENLYREFSEFSGGQVSFEIRTLREFPLASVREHTFNKMLGIAEYGIAYSEHATSVSDVHFSKADPVGVSDAGGHVAFLHYDKTGFPVNSGVVRELLVEAMVASDRRRHRAMEICWPTLGHCVVADQAIPFVQSTTIGIRDTLAAGWKPESHDLLVGPSAKAATGVCRLQSDGSKNYRDLTYPAFNRVRKDYLNRTQYNISVPSATVYVSCGAATAGGCYTNARPLSGEPTSSVAVTNSRTGYSVVCNRAMGNFESFAGGSAAQATGCAYRSNRNPVATLTYSYAVVGGEPFLSRSTNGTVFQNIPKIKDRCLIVQ